MQDEMERRATDKRWALANGYLLEAADAAEKLSVVVNYVREIVKGRVNAVNLIGPPMADAVEEFSSRLIASIRAADEAKQGLRESR